MVDTYYFPNKNSDGLVEYLGSVGIDANRIPLEGLSAEGYTYWPDPNDGGKYRVTTSGRRNDSWDQQLKWSNPEVYKNVVLLLNGASLDEVVPQADKPKAEPKPPVAPKSTNPGPRGSEKIVKPTKATPEVAPPKKVAPKK